MRGWSLYCCRTFFALSQSKLPTIIFNQVVVDEVNELRTERLEHVAWEHSKWDSPLSGSCKTFGVTFSVPLGDNKHNHHPANSFFVWLVESTANV